MLLIQMANGCGNWRFKMYFGIIFVQLGHVYKYSFLMDLIKVDEVGLKSVV